MRRLHLFSVVIVVALLCSTCFSSCSLNDDEPEYSGPLTELYNDPTFLAGYYNNIVQSALEFKPGIKWSKTLAVPDGSFTVSCPGNDKQAEELTASLKMLKKLILRSGAGADKGENDYGDEYNGPLLNEVPTEIVRYTDYSDESPSTFTMFLYVPSEDGESVIVDDVSADTVFGKIDLDPIKKEFDKISDRFIVDSINVVQIDSKISITVDRSNDGVLLIKYIRPMDVTVGFTGGKDLPELDHCEVSFRAESKLTVEFDWEDPDV